MAGNSGTLPTGLSGNQRQYWESYWNHTTLDTHQSAVSELTLQDVLQGEGDDVVQVLDLEDRNK
jgi:hypothetical protein